MAYEGAGIALATAAAAAGNFISKNWNKFKNWFGGSKTRTAAQWQSQYNNVNSILLNNALNPATKRQVNWNSIANFVNDIWNFASPYIMGNKIQQQATKDAEAAQERQYQYELMGLGVQNEYNLQNMAQSYEYNKLLQQDAQQWQQMMSSTAHQRERADLEAAGMNPLLSVNNGASTGSVGASSVGMGQAGDIGVGLTNEYNQRIAGWQTAIQMQQMQSNLKDAAANRAMTWKSIEEAESRIAKNISDRNYTDVLHDLTLIKKKYADIREKKEIDQIIENIDYQEGMLSVQRKLSEIEQQRADIQTRIGYTTIDMNKKEAEYKEHLKRKLRLDMINNEMGKFKSGGGSLNTSFGVGKNGLNIGVSANKNYSRY